MRPFRSNAAFTLVEMIVVIVLLTVMAAVVLPRLFTRSGREARAEAESVASLVGIAARRANLTTQRIAIDFNEGVFQLMVLRPRDPESFAVGNSEWVPDLLTQSVPLEHLSLTSILRDITRLSTQNFRIEMGQGARTELLITLQAPDERAWTIWLPPELDGALLLDADADTSNVPQRVMDLDRAGQGLTAW